MQLALVCVGAGSGRRFGSDKLVQRLGDRSVLERSLAALSSAFPEAPVVVVVAPERISRWRTTLATRFPDAEVIGGGRRRQDSVRLGVEAAVRRGADVVAVHDAARPAVHPEDVRDVVGALDPAVGAVLCGVVADTVKRVDADGFIRATVDRDLLRLAQTPQAFAVEALVGAWAEQDFDREWTDEAALLEAAGLDVRCVPARHPNPKLTTPDDLRLLRALVRKGVRGGG